MLVADEILDAEQVAEILQLNPQTIKRMANRNELPGFRVAGQWRFRREAIDQYIRDLETQQKRQSENEENK